MISRDISRQLIELFRQYPIVTVTGPRQSGKTVLCRSTFPGLGYADLGMPHERDFAAADPRGFLARLGEGAIIDEVQRVPDLLSHLQVTADERGRNGLFVLTGSEDFRFSQAISQSLAGRTAQLHLLPFSLTERRQAGGSGAVDDILYSGFYPRIIDQGLAQTQALADYFETYVERDVRRIGEIRQLSHFRRFMRLCAGRVGQPVNLSSLGSDAGVSHTTAREWLTILETSYIIFQLSPYHAQIRRRLVKSPRLYFCDVGLAAYLIGIENAGQLATHPLRGALFENAVVAEALKHRLNRGRQPDLRFFQDAKGLSCALLYPTDHGIAAIDVTAGATIATDSFRSVHRVAGLVPGVSQEIVVYGGTVRQTRSDSEAIPLGELGGALEKLEVDREIAGFVDENRVQVPDPDDDHPADEHRAHASGQPIPMTTIPRTSTGHTHPARMTTIPRTSNGYRHPARMMWRH
jgi:predicted AAA+ superfamily ATPase